MWSMCLRMAMNVGWKSCSGVRGRGPGPRRLRGPAGIGIEHEDAVGEVDRFVEVVGDEDDGDVDVLQISSR